MSKKGLSVAIVVLIVLIAGVLWLNNDITQKQNEGIGGTISKNLVELSDDNPTFDHWGQNFPDYLDM